MPTLQKAVAEVRELEIEEMDLVAGGSYCMTTSETQTATYEAVSVVINGQTVTMWVQGDMATQITTGYGWD